MFEKREVDAADLAAVESELVTLAGHLAAATCRFLQLLAEFDARRGWAGPGLRTCAHWLNWRVGLSLRTARDHLRVAHALRELPEITAAFAAGQLSYSKVRALTRIAGPATEHDLLAVALCGTASQLDDLVRAARSCRDPRPAAARRGLRSSTLADGSMLVRLRIPAEQGEQLLAVIEAHLAGAESNGSAEPSAPAAVEEDVDIRADEHAPGPAADPTAARRLDALLDLVVGGAGPPAATLVVHVRADANDHAGPDRPAAWIEGGPPIAVSTASRLTCTAAVQALLVDRRGNPLHLGRTRRTVTRRQLRALRVRDRDRCVFPGCVTRHHLDAHHLRWWSHGGCTDLDNLALVCRFHHTLIHDSGYRLLPTADGFTAVRPDGTTVPAAGPPTGGAVDDLLARHAAAIIAVDDRTITPEWGGERLDLDQALTWLLPALDAEQAAA